MPAKPTFVDGPPHLIPHFLVYLLDMVGVRVGTDSNNADSDIRILPLDGVAHNAKRNRLAENGPRRVPLDLIGMDFQNITES